MTSQDLIHSSCSIPTIYSSSPKNTFTGNHASPQTLNLSWMPLSAFISSSVKLQSSSSKFALIRDSVTLLGRTLYPLCRPHMMSTCWGDLPLALAMDSRASFLLSGESVDPRGE